MSMNITKHPDEDHLRLLSIFQYILAGISVLEGCCPLCYFGFGIAIMAGAFDGDRNPPPPEMGLILSIICGAITLYAWIWCLLEVFAAHSLGKHKYYRFCFVMACLELLNLP